MRHRILSLIRKETLHILRDPRSLYLAVGLPVLLVIIFGYAITFDVNNVRLGVVDLDNSPLSRDLIFRLHASPYFDITSHETVYRGMDKLLDEGKAKIIIVIPPRFSQRLNKGKDVKLQLLTDGSDNNTAQVAQGYLLSLIQMFSVDFLKDNLNRNYSLAQTGIPPIQLEPRIWYNPDLRSVNFIVPGLIAVVMMILAAMLTSLTVAREWENGTMEQLISSPIKPIEVIIGKLVPYYFLGLLQTILVIAVGALLFKVPFKGDLLLLFLVSSVFLVCGMGIGLFISAATRSQQLSFMLSVILTMLPAFILSGFIFPISSMPRIIQILTYLVPARYFLIALRGIFLKGVGLSVLWPQVLLLCLFAIGIMAACAKKMTMRLD
jgi:ABC-2 type transport system permease protein